MESYTKHFAGTFERNE